MKKIIKTINEHLDSGQGLDYYELLQIQKYISENHNSFKVNFGNELYLLLEKHKDIIKVIIDDLPDEIFDEKLYKKSFTNSEIKLIISGLLSKRINTESEDGDIPEVIL